MKRLLFFGGSALTAMVLAAVPAITSAQLQTFPNKMVKVVVPYPPGGTTDTTGRGVAQRLSELWGQPVIIENRPGAGATIGAEYVSKAAPDGYTLIYADDGTFVITPHLYSKLNYNALTDFAPITVVFRSPLVLAVGSAVPVKDFKDLLVFVKANPGKITFASWGSGSMGHLAVEQLKQAAGLNLLHVPYKGGIPALNDVLGGRVGLMMASYISFAGHDKAGKLKVVAVAGEKRLSVRPDIPTVSESGVPGYTMTTWFGMMAPAGTPAPVLDKIRADVVKVLQDPRPEGFNEKYLKPNGDQAGGDSREEFNSLIKADYDRWGRLVKAAGVKLD
ncbi:MAG: tripartite tricarboxylate transporter substrate binding protein [Betaproteobacteria bacterium]|nr:tripartite tricarboxylate transporter substrate binding protein [Betaproteobacteria bacterium]